MLQNAISEHIGREAEKSHGLPEERCRRGTGRIFHWRSQNHKYLFSVI